jgi:adenylate kinase
VKRRIVLLGLPASGKGTQAEMIKTTYHLPTASPGAILRAESKARTPMGIEAEKLTNDGKLVSDEIVNGLVKNWLAQHGEGFVFDGYPRSYSQMTAFDEMLAERGTRMELALLLDVSIATVRDRVSRRFICSQCGLVASVGLNVTSHAAGCPRCGNALVKRTDDTMETLDLRMREYAEKTWPLIGIYEGRKLLRRIDANGSPDVVFQSVAACLEMA